MFKLDVTFDIVEKLIKISEDIIIVIGKPKNRFFNEYIKHYDNDFYEPLSSRTNLDAFSEKISSLSTTFVILYKNEIAGLIASYFYDKELNNGFITLVHVKSEYRGLGLSYHLVKTVQSYTKENGFNQVNLVVYKDNISAYKLYTRCGFLVTSENNGRCNMCWTNK